MNARNKYRSLALSLLGGLCAAAFNFSALAAGPSAVSANVSPTTGYTVTGSTFRVPPSATFSPIKDITTYSKYAGGIAQESRAGITITAIKQAQEVKGRFLFPKQGLKESLKSCLKGRCIAGPAVLAGYAGIQALFSGLDWIMLEGGEIVKEDKLAPPLAQCADFPGKQCITQNYSGGGCIFSDCRDLPKPPNDSYTLLISTRGQPNCTGHFDETCGRVVLLGCPAGYDGYCFQGVTSRYADGFGVYVRDLPPVDLSAYVPVTDAEIESGVQGSYDPDTTDMPPIVAGQPPEYPEYEITDAPRLSTPPKTTTKYDANGDPVEVTETNIWYDFGVSNNPSKQPDVDTTKTEQTQGYGPTGAPTGSTTTVTPESPAAVRPPQIDIPTDCDFMPTVCAWLDWWKKDWEPDNDGPKIEDQKQVIDLRDHEETVVIGPNSAACPAPYELTIPFVNTTVQVSYQPFCDLADILRPLLLALAYFAAAYLTIRSI